MGACFSGLRPGWPYGPRPAPKSVKRPEHQTSKSGPPDDDAQPICENTIDSQISEQTRSRLSCTSEFMQKPVYVNAVYYPNWQAYLGQTPAILHLDNVSHLFYAFAKIDGDGSVLLTDQYADLEMPVDGSKGCINALTRLRREKYPSLNIILSVGGEAESHHFVKMTANQSRLEQFVRTARSLVDELGLNGIDINWGHPANSTECKQYTQLLKCLRVALPFPAYQLTTCVPARLRALEHMNLGEISRHVDMVNLMAYDFAGPSSPASRSGHHAQLRCPKQGQGTNGSAKMSGAIAVQYLLNAGVPNKKLVLGIPLFGRSFLGATGPNQPFSGYGGRDGMFEYRDLPMSNDKGKGKATAGDEDVDAITPCAEQFDSRLVAAWCVGPQTPDGGGFITYDNAMSVEAKAWFVVRESLGGLFYWHIGFDKPKKHGSLVELGGKELGLGNRRNSFWARVG